MDKLRELLTLFLALFLVPVAAGCDDLYGFAVLLFLTMLTVVMSFANVSMLRLRRPRRRLSRRVRSIQKLSRRA
ncbi:MULTISPECIES: hypothetical protein [Anaerotruncus]|uniref:hypothetical protein n=1 Tax=Anaerotruncus TaxID=244127 RepID=UPI0011C213E8|nr:MULTISPECIES: hypothetical protein [Anaerotruncus]